MAVALRYSCSCDNAEEIVNDAFLKIYIDLKNFVPRFDNTVASFTAWLEKVVVNACGDQKRKYAVKEMMTNVDPGQAVLCK